MTTRDDIRRWLAEVRPGSSARWMLVLCDTFDNTDFPFYCDTPADVWAKIDECGDRNMLRLMECYDLSANLEVQISQSRVRNMPPRPPR